MPKRKRPPADSRRPGRADPSRAQQLSDFLKYLEAECGMSANTIQAYRSDLQQFFGWYAEHGPDSFSQLSLRVLSAYLQQLHERQLAASTIARHLISIKMFFRYLVFEGVLLESAAELLNSPKLWQHLPKVLSPDMVNQLLDAPNGDDRFSMRDRGPIVVVVCDRLPRFGGHQYAIAGPVSRRGLLSLYRQREQRAACVTESCLPRSPDSLPCTRTTSYAGRVISMAACDKTRSATLADYGMETRKEVCGSNRL